VQPTDLIAQLRSAKDGLCCRVDGRPLDVRKDMCVGVHCQANLAVAEGVLVPATLGATRMNDVAARRTSRAADGNASEVTNWSEPVPKPAWVSTGLASGFRLMAARA
jgi:hypothetical protein